MGFINSTFTKLQSKAERDVQGQQYQEHNRVKKLDRFYSYIHYK